MKIALFALALLIGVLPAPTRAQTINFNGLPGANGSPFTSYSEAGYNVTLFMGAICEAHLFGNPVPSLFGGIVCNVTSRSSVLRITRTGGGSFGFVGADLVAQNGPGSFSFQGFLSGTSQFFSSGTIAGPPVGFFTYAGPSPLTNIDELRVSLSLSGTGTTYNIDNIQLHSVTVIPEPASVVLLATGLVGVLGLVRLKRISWIAS